MRNVVEGVPAYISYCRKCAQKLNIITHTHFLSDYSYLQDFQEQEQADSVSSIPQHCHYCGFPYQQFSQLKRLGCSECYTAFLPAIKEQLARLHWQPFHVGSSPHDFPEATHQYHQLFSLYTARDTAVNAMEYSKANEFQNQIDILEALFPEQQHPTQFVHKKHDS